MDIENAIKNKNLLSFSYDGYARIVEPHTYGIDTKGHLALRAYQVKGGSESGEYSGWKLFHATRITGLSTLSEHFLHARTGYKRGDKGFSTIRAQL
jgi:predicted DNA-binding transcriptional regulator YafY